MDVSVKTLLKTVLYLAGIAYALWWAYMYYSFFGPEPSIVTACLYGSLFVVGRLILKRQ